MSRRTPVLAAALAVLASGCAMPLFSRCRTGETPVVSDHLYFGTARPGGVVTAKEWMAFLNHEVKPRLPRGFTAWDSAGASQNRSGSLDREASHVLFVVHPDDAASEEALRSISATYRQRFEQESVLRVRSRACASLGESR